MKRLLGSGLAVVCLSLTLVFAPRGVAAEEIPSLYLSELRVVAQDDPRFAMPGWDDSSWQTVSLYDFDGLDGVYWIRTHFEIEERHIPADRPLGLAFAALATTEIYWDGRRLPSSGVAGRSRDEEIPSEINQVLYLPDSLVTPGPHVLAMRVSHHHRGFDPSTGFWYSVVAPYDELLAWQRNYTWIALLSLSAMLVVGLYYLALFGLNRRERSNLLLGLLCLAAGALLVAEAIRPILGYTYDWHIHRLRLVTGLTWIVNALLLGYLWVRYPAPDRRWWAVAAAVGLTVPLFAFHGWDPKAMFMFFVGLTLAVLWCLRAAIRRQPGSLFALIGVGACLAVEIWAPLRFSDQTFFLALDLLLVSLLVGHAVHVRRLEREREEIRVRSARLENELLKRHLQPHFLMNTLTALSGWIEEDPKKAERMLDAVAEEYRTLLAISDRALIPLSVELRLCDSHLNVMSLRKDQPYVLRRRLEDAETAVPPALVHTLVENATTHNAGPVEMSLSQQQTDGKVELVFESSFASGDGKADPSPSASGTGTGRRYLESRLEESFGGEWTLEWGRSGNRFRTVITFPRRT